MASLLPTPLPAPGQSFANTSLGGTVKGTTDFIKSFYFLSLYCAFVTLIKKLYLKMPLLKQWDNSQLIP